MARVGDHEPPARRAFRPGQSSPPKPPAKPAPQISSSSPRLLLQIIKTRKRRMSVCHTSSRPIFSPPLLHWGGTPLSPQPHENKNVRPMEAIFRLRNKELTLSGIRVIRRNKGVTGSALREKPRFSRHFPLEKGLQAVRRLIPVPWSSYLPMTSIATGIVLGGMQAVSLQA